MDILANVKQLEADLSAANANKTDLEARIVELGDKYTQKDEQAKAATEALALKDTEISELKEALTAKAEEFQGLAARMAELEASQKTAEEKAIELVATQGIAAPKVNLVAGNSKTKAELLAEYGALLKTDSVKAGAFYEANRAAIVR